MSEARLDTLIPRLRTLVSAGHYMDQTDGNLLERFVAHRDELAFKTLVRRHGPLILGVCRRVLGAGPEIDDVFQATFLVLARKAGSIRRQASVAGWLYGVAFRLSRKQKKRLGRQRLHEHSTDNFEAFTETRPMGNDPAQQASLQELGAILDEEVQRLPAKNREIFILCHVEGLSAAEAAKRLGCPLPTLKSRLARARDLIRQRLVRRGVTLSTTGVALVFAEQTARATVPHKVVHAALQAALAFAAKPVAGGVVSVQAAALAQGFLKTMTITKLSLAFLAVFTVTLLGFGAAGAPKQTPEMAVPPVVNTALIAVAVKQPPVAKEKQNKGTLRVVVLDAKSKPLAGAEVHVTILTDEKNFQWSRDYQTDATGVALVELPKTFSIVALYASKGTFTWQCAGWSENELNSGTQLPAEYIFQLDPAVTAGGRVVDEQGKPIVGVKVQVDTVGNPKPANSDGRACYDGSLAHGTDAAMTDADGRWRIANVPSHPDTKLTLLISHPDYVSDEEYGGIQKESGVTMAMLIEDKAVLNLKRGIIVQGQVTDPAGKPIKDAVIVLGDDPYMTRLPSKFAADADGKFRLPAIAPRETTLTVLAPEWAPQMRKVNIQVGLPPQDFKMERGKPIRLKVVDDAGKPIPNASVSISGWNGSGSIQIIRKSSTYNKLPDPKIPPQADANGVWEWTSAPDSPVKLSVWSKGYASAEFEIAGGDPVRTVTLKGQHVITGNVTDAVTGKAIPAFTVIPVYVFNKDALSAGRTHAVVGKNGAFSLVPSRAENSWRVRIEALGYRTQDGPEFRVGDDSPRTQDFKLTPSPPLVGLVLDTVGKPLAKAKVHLATPTEYADIDSSFGHNATHTDSDGRFVFPDPGVACAVVVQTPTAFARADFPADQHDLGTLKVQPWATVRGQLHDGGKPVSGAIIFLHPIGIYNRGMPDVRTSFQIPTDPDGRFEFPLVAPGPVSVHAYLGPWEDEGFRSGPSVPLDLKPGQRIELDLGGAGTIIKGKVTLTGKIPAGLDSTYSINHLILREPGITPPPEIAKLGFDIRDGWRLAWGHTSEGNTYLHTLRNWFVKLAPDGTFQISGVPPGEYDLAIEIFAKASPCLVDALARKVVRVTVTAKDVANGELTLPEIPATVDPVPEIGDTPILTFQRPDGKPGTLADTRGGYTVVHFWASWCAACKQHFPALARLQEKFANNGLTMLGLALDDDSVAWQAALKQHDLKGPQGRLTTASVSGVSSVPAYWLLDPAGAIVAKVHNLEELEAILAARLK